MSGLETAIRNALEKSDRASAEIRARIYQSSRQALEAGLRKQGVDDPAIVAQQRQRLEMLIGRIEAEERDRLLSEVEKQLRRQEPPVEAPRLAPQTHGARMSAVSSDDGLSVEPESRAQGAGSRAASFDGLRAQRDDPPPAGAAGRRDGDEALLAFRPERAAGAGKRRRGLFARLFMLLTIVGFAGLGLWWVNSSGLLLSEEQRDTSVRNPPAQVPPEDFTGAEPAPSLEAGRGFSNDWVEVFNAERGNAGIRAGSLASIEDIALPAGKALRVASRSAADSGNVSIEVPVEVLRDIAGKASTISVTLQSSSDRKTQVSITCDFASLGGCARHRFTAMPERADMLISVTFDKAFTPNGAGRILINSDIDGEGRPVNLYSVRVLPGGQ